MENLVCDNEKAKAGLSVKKRNKSFPIKEIQRKYYPEVPDSDFGRIVAADVVSSNLQTGKLGMYAKWMLRLYNTQRIKMDDLRYVKQFIPVFEQLKNSNRLQDRDINSYTSLSDMYTVVQPYLDGAPTSKTAKTQWIKRYKAEKLYDDETFTVIHPKTQAASCLYGAGTRWCTAAKNNSAFDEYNDQGKLYIIIHKPTGKKYQLHFESNRFTDENNDTISQDERNAFEAYTGLTELFIRELSMTPESYIKNARLAQFYLVIDNF
jgi:hypothetical protein